LLVFHSVSPSAVSIKPPWTGVWDHSFYVGCVSACPIFTGEDLSARTSVPASWAVSPKFLREAGQHREVF